MSATLIKPYNGYKNIELIEKVGNKWRVIICGSSKEIEMYENEFIID